LCIYNADSYDEAYLADAIVGLVADYQIALWKYPLVGVIMCSAIVCVLLPIYLQGATCWNISKQVEFQIPSIPVMKLGANNANPLATAPEEISIVVTNLIHMMNSEEEVLSWREITNGKITGPARASILIGLIWIIFACGYQFLFLFATPDYGKPTNPVTIYTVLAPSIVAVVYILQFVYVFTCGGRFKHQPQTFMVITSERGLVLTNNCTWEDLDLL
jgi:hypothetical protein